MADEILPQQGPDKDSDAKTTASTAPPIDGGGLPPYPTAPGVYLPYLTVPPTPPGGSPKLEWDFA